MREKWTSAKDCRPDCSLLEEGDVLPVEDPQCLLQRLDLLLAARDTVLVAHARVHAGRLQLVVVRESCVELLLRALKISLLRRQRGLLVRLLRGLVLHVLGVRRTVDGRLARELVEGLLRLSLRRLRVRLEASEVRLDHLEHTDNAAVLRLHARVGLIEDLRLLTLEKRRRLGRLLVELLENRERLSDGRLSLDGVLDRLLVRRFLLLADRCRLSHGLVDLGNLGREVRDLLRQLRDRRAELVDLGVERLDGRNLLLARLLVRGELRVAPALVLGLLVRLLHQAHDEVLDHLLHLHERVLSNANRERRQHTAVDRRALLTEELSHARLARVLRSNRELDERHRLRLHEARQVLVGVAGNRAGRQDLDRLVDRRELVRAELLARLEVRGLLRALRNEVVEVSLIRVTRGGRVREVTLLLRGLLELRRLLLRLRLAVLRRRLDLRREVLHQHLVRVAGVAFLLLEVRTLVLELVLELLEHVDDARGLELVRVRLRRRHSHRVLAKLVPLRQERGDGLLRVLRNRLQHLDLDQLRYVVVLLLHGRNRTLKSVNGLRVVLVRRKVVRVLHLANLRRRLLIALVNRDVLVELGDLLGKRGSIRLVLLDRRDQLLHLRSSLLDGALLFNRGVIAELLVCSELHLLLVLFLLPLLGHSLQQLDDLLHRGNLRREHKNEQTQNTHRGW